MLIKIPSQLAFDILKTALSWGIALLWFMRKEIILEIAISTFIGLLLYLKKRIHINLRKNYQIK